MGGKIVWGSLGSLLGPDWLPSAPVARPGGWWASPPARCLWPLRSLKGCGSGWPVCQIPCEDEPPALGLCRLPSSRNRNGAGRQLASQEGPGSLVGTSTLPRPAHTLWASLSSLLNGGPGGPVVWGGGENARHWGEHLDPRKQAWGCLKGEWAVAPPWAILALSVPCLQWIHTRAQAP